ncbi:MAG: hypothetical protein MJZ68_01080 [archaeon]|nr:hypothetical protein [archaeon]
MAKLGEDAWMWYIRTEAVDGKLVGEPVREIYTVLSVHGMAVRVKKEVPGCDPEILETSVRHGSLIFDVSKLALVKSEKIPTCIGQVTVDVCSKVDIDGYETVYIDDNDIVFRHVEGIRNGDGTQKVVARELVAIGF